MRVLREPRPLASRDFGVLSHNVSASRKENDGGDLCAVAGPIHRDGNCFAGYFLQLKGTSFQPLGDLTVDCVGRHADNLALKVPRSASMRPKRLL